VKRKKDPSDPRLINSVQRAIEILALFNVRERELGITEIATHLGVAKSTVAGLVYTLEKNGYMDQDQDTRRYRLGLRLIERAATALDTIEIRQIAFPYIARLRDSFDESVYLGVPRNSEIVIIGRVLCSKVLGVRTGIGESIPFLETAVGTAYLSGQADDFVQQAIDDHLGQTTQTPKKSQIQSIRREISEAGQTGYAVNHRGREGGVSYIASPIFDITGSSIATVSVSVPTIRLPSTAIPEFGESVRETALSISSELGYQGFTREREI
jgi:DNA-binding IclR family transcriptional regulator